MTTPTRPIPTPIASDRERRVFTHAQAELRAGAPAADGALPQLVGHAAVFNTDTPIGPPSDPYWIERFAPGAFRASIAADDIRALFNHAETIVLGRNRAGTLQLREDDVGLAVTISPPNTTQARDVVELITRGDISQMSFGFRSQAETWEYRDDGVPLRTIEAVQLFEVSPITFAAYPTTDIAVRSALGVLEEARKAGRLPAREDAAGALDVMRRRLELAALGA